MANLGRFDQQPIEYKLRKVDYDRWLSTGELITDYQLTLTTIRRQDETETGNDFVVTPRFIDPETQRAVFYYAGYGYDRDEYKIEITITTNQLQVRQDEIWYRIIEV